MKIGLFYATSTGNTENMANEIKAQMGAMDITLENVCNAKSDAMQNYDALIMGISTWGDGDLQDDWEEYFENITAEGVGGKTVALFGLGDQEDYGDYFLNAMGTLHAKLVKLGANIVGNWPTDGYEFDDSTAVVDGMFVGLALDENNQDDLSADRIKEWVAQIRPHFS
ncbi:MAG: flavodoxin [Sulfurimonadaceae bacterium]|jgi:flavodoxin I